MISFNERLHSLSRMCSYNSRCSISRLLRISFDRLAKTFALMSSDLDYLRVKSRFKLSLLPSLMRLAATLLSKRTLCVFSSIMMTLWSKSSTSLLQQLCFPFCPEFEFKSNYPCSCTGKESAIVAAETSIDESCDAADRD